jgi:hypothetical protein
MRIAVLADTHNRLPGHLPPLLAGADEIWHLGDVTDAGCLRPLEALGVPLRVVRGNCDWGTDWPLVLDLEREGVQVRLVHIPPGEVPSGVDLLLHGHTHVPRNERVGAVRFLNPGSVSGPRGGSVASFAWLTLERGVPQRWEVVPVSGRL